MMWSTARGPAGSMFVTVLANPARRATGAGQPVADPFFRIALIEIQRAMQRHQAIRAV
jgi:hypothetical protein